MERHEWLTTGWKKSDVKGCCGGFGTDKEFQCGFLACGRPESHFGPEDGTVGICEHFKRKDQPSWIKDVSNSPEWCPVRLTVKKVKRLQAEVEE